MDLIYETLLPTPPGSAADYVPWGALEVTPFTKAVRTALVGAPE